MHELGVPSYIMGSLAAAVRPHDLRRSLASMLCPTPHHSLPAADEEGATLGRAAAAGGAVVERVAKDLSSLTREQRLAAVQQDAPELLQLIAELREGLTEVRSRVGPLLKEVRRLCFTELHLMEQGVSVCTVVDGPAWGGCSSRCTAAFSRWPA